MNIVEHNIETNEITQIELSVSQVQKIEADNAANKAKIAELNAERESLENQRNAPKIAILEKLGLTIEEAKSLIS